MSGEETKTESKVKKGSEKKVESKAIETIDDNFLSRIQNKLATSNSDELKKINKHVEDAQNFAATVKDFDGYFRPIQEKRNVVWNELAKHNTFDIPINVNAGKPDVPANFSKTITLSYNDASNEQMQYIESLRSKMDDLNRIERVASTLTVSDMEKKGIKLPLNYLTVSTEAVDAKENLLISRIIVFCGVDKETAKHIALICHATTLSSILDSWEFRNRTGFPNLSPERTPNTSPSGYQ